MNKFLAILASNLLAVSAFAAEGAQQGSGYESILLLVVFFAIFYFLLIRPQMKKNKAHRALVGGIAKGDEVVTSAGIVGTLMLSLKMVGAAPVPPPRPSKMI